MARIAGIDLPRDKTAQYALPLIYGIGKHNVIELLEKAGAKVDYHDPFIPRVKPSREHAGLTGRKSVPLNARSLGAADAVLIVTDHDDVDYSMVAKHARLVLDTRNAMTRAGVAGRHIRKA